jgi:hypothetical protein
MFSFLHTKKGLAVTAHINLRSHKSHSIVATLPFTYGISQQQFVSNFFLFSVLCLFV